MTSVEARSSTVISTCTGVSTGNASGAVVFSRTSTVIAEASAGVVRVATMASSGAPPPVWMRAFSPG
jgi:hypothetical protein